MAMIVGNKGSSGKHGARPNVNVTPLVDVALVVLIIFMVVTPMMMKTFWLNLPKKSEEQAESKDPKPVSDDAPLVMTLGRDGSVKINRSVVERKDLPQKLPRMLAANKHKVLFFDAADGTKYGTAVALMDEARCAGAKSIAIVTDRIAN